MMLEICRTEGEIPQLDDAIFIRESSVAINYALSVAARALAQKSFALTQKHNSPGC